MLSSALIKEFKTIMADSGETMTDAEAFDAATKLISFFELLNGQNQRLASAKIINKKQKNAKRKPKAKTSKD